MATTTTPTYTGAVAGNIHASSTIAASGTANDNWDGSAVFETQVHVKAVVGTAAGTNGLRIDVYRRYGSSPTTSGTTFLTYTLPSVDSTTTDFDFFLPTGKYNIKLTNLDATNALTAVVVTGDTVTNLSTA